jgi:hypothetical protein
MLDDETIVELTDEFILDFLNTRGKNVESNHRDDSRGDFMDIVLEGAAIMFESRDPSEWGSDIR